MKILKLSWKNFASYGEEIQTIDFNNDSSLWLLNGLNGSGKSTIADVLSFALFGKVEGKNKTDLPNRFNKKLYTEIELECKTKNVKIIRGATPNILKVTVENKEIDLSGDGVQKYLETEVFEIPYTIFKNMLVLSINDFKSFLTMSPADKRQIFDKLFGFTILNQIKENNKNEKNNLKNSIEKQKIIINQHQKQIQNVLNLIEETKQKHNIDKLEIEKELNLKIKSLQDEQSKILEIGKHQKISLQSLQSEFNRINQLINKTNGENRLLENVLSVHKHNKQCPTCLSDLTDCSNITNKLQNDLTENVRYIDNLEKDLKNVSNNINTSEKEINQFREKYLTLKMQIDECDVKLKSLSSNSYDISNLEKLIEKSNNDLSESENTLNKLEHDFTFLNLYDDMLSENGIKSIIIKNMLPNLNYDILNLCNEIGFKYNFEFDENLDVNMFKINDIVPIKTLSTGEKKLADFICLVAFLKYIKLKFPSVNLLFFDEIFSSIDVNKIYEVSRLLKNLTKKQNLNIFVMHHATLPSEYFDKSCDVLNVDGFSKIELN